MLRPWYHFLRVEDIKKEYLNFNNIKTILLDIDGTLVPHNFPVPISPIKEWIEERKKEGRKVILFSNNRKERVEEFAKELDVPFYFRAHKPLQGSFKRIKREEEGKICIIGDQVFTDVLGGNLAGIVTILVEPVGDSPKGFQKLKRKMEKPFRKAR